MNAVITFKVIEHNSSDYKLAVSLREEILRKPLGLTISLDSLAKEQAYIHIVGIQNNKVVATATLVPEGSTCRMRFVAVTNEMQNTGIGTKLMDYCEQQAATLGFKSIYCHARKTAVQFYLNNQYLPEGDYFDEISIPHLKLKKIL